MFYDFLLFFFFLLSGPIDVGLMAVFFYRLKFENGLFKKSISYTLPNGCNELQTEHVKAWDSMELSELLSSVGLHVKTIKGDYDFSEYHDDSPRMILIAEKK